MVYLWNVHPAECLALYNRGYTICEIAALLNTSKSTVARRLALRADYVPTRKHSCNRPKLMPCVPGQGNVFSLLGLCPSPDSGPSE